MSELRTRRGAAARALRVAAAGGATLLLGGCAPELVVAGAYVPAWLVCAAAGLFAAALVRAALGPRLPWPLASYAALACIVGGLAWLAWLRG